MVRLMTVHMWKSDRGKICLVQRKESKRDRLPEGSGDAKVLVCRQMTYPHVKIVVISDKRIVGCESVRRSHRHDHRKHHSMTLIY